MRRSASKWKGGSGSGLASRRIIRTEKKELKTIEREEIKRTPKL
jgi:hypothetical protein